MQKTRFGSVGAISAGQNASASKAMMIGGALLATVALLSTDIVFGAGTNTGVQAGFSQIGATLTTLVRGAGGYLILIVSVIVAAITLMATGRWTYVVTALAVSLFLGYGLNIISSRGGVTATTDMISGIELLPAADALNAVILPVEALTSK